MKGRKDTKGFQVLFIRDEKEFYSLIDERMEEDGFEVVETSPTSRERTQLEVSNS